MPYPTPLPQFDTQEKTSQSPQKPTRLPIELQALILSTIIGICTLHVMHIIETAKKNTEYINIAIGILNSPITDTSRPLRQWAVRMITAYSPTPLQLDDDKMINFGGVIIFSGEHKLKKHTENPTSEPVAKGVERLLVPTAPNTPKSTQ